MRKKTYAAFGVLIGLLFALWGCPQKPPPPPEPEKPDLVRLAPEDYPRFADDMNYDGLDQAIQKSLLYLNRIPPDRTFSLGEETVSAAHVKRSLERFQDILFLKPTPDDLNRFIRENFRVYGSLAPAPEPPTTDESEEESEPESEPDAPLLKTAENAVLFTGYFEPLLQGSRSQGGPYQYPVYGMPQDIAVVDLSLFSDKYAGEKIIGRVSGKSFVPYYERKEIEEKGVLRNNAPVRAWVDDPIDLFFLQIQGSGKIELPDKEIIDVHYSGKNGRPYRAIGRLLIDEGKVSKEEMSMQRIRQYLEENPDDADRVMNYNPSYVFFTIEDEGPKGALNVVLTPGRSLAVDRGIFPMTALAFVRTEKPLLDHEGRIREWTHFSRFMLHQDTGGAIKDADRADIFWGSGHYAEVAAGHLRHRGEHYVLLLNPDK